MQSTSPSELLWAYLKQVHWVLLAAVLVFLGLMLLPLAGPLMQALPAIEQTHLVFELAAVVVAALIAISTWNTLEPRRCGRDCILIAGFVAVAVLDLVHALTYEHAVGPTATTDPQQSIFFWLAARSLAVMTLLMLALNSGPNLTRRVALGVGALVAGSLLWVGHFHLDRFPATFLPGQGLTAFKIGFEVMLCALNVCAAVLFVVRANPDTQERNRMLATACLLQALGGLVFTQYVSIGDFINGVGHLFKIAAYVYLYRALYLAQIRRPFQKVQETQRELREASEALAAQRQALELTLVSVSQGICRFGADGRIRFFNPRVMDLLDLSPSVLHDGAHVTDILSFQIARGDMDRASDFSDPSIRGLVLARRFDELPDRYSRKTLGGKVIEVHTQTLADGGVLRTYTDVSEYTRLNDALKRERERLTNLLAGTQAGTWFWDARTGEAEVDERWAAMVGFTATQYRQAHGTQWQHRVHPDDLPRLRDALFRHLRGETDFLQVEFRFLHKDGYWVWIQSRGQVNARDADGRALNASGIHLDISVLKATEAALVETYERLRENTRQLETTLDSISQGIVLINPEGRVVTYNRRANELLDLPEGMLANRPNHAEIIELQRQRGDFGPDNTWIESHARTYLVSREQGAMPDSYVRRTRQDRAIEVRTKKLPQGGMVRTFTDVTDYVNTLEALERDVTQRVAAEAEVRVLNESLEQRVAERTADLERSMKDMEAISYSIAHDLRAPLQAVNGFVSLVAQREKEQLSEASRHMLNRILAASRNMAQMIDDLLALFRVVRAELVTSPVDMAALAQATAEALASSSTRARVLIGDLPAAMGDATLLRQVFMNLIDNALKYSRDAAAPRVEVGHDAATDAYFVRDNGVGFDMAYAGKLFGVFQRLHAVTEFQGSGVGLAVVARIVERHGGRIWADAAVGQGATFFFTLGATRVRLLGAEDVDAGSRAPA